MRSIKTGMIALLALSSCFGKKSFDYYSDQAYAEYGVKGDKTSQPGNVVPYYADDTNLQKRIGQDGQPHPKDDYPQFSTLLSQQQPANGQPSGVEMGMKASSGFGTMPPQFIEDSKPMPYVLNNTENKADTIISRPISEQNVKNEYYATYLSVLGNEYESYSKLLLQQGYNSDSQLLHSKSSTALSGHDVMFETEYSFELPLDKRSVIVQHRKVLENAKVRTEILRENPEMMAKLQASYDCMVIEAKNRMYSQKTQCGMHFFTTLDNLQKIYGNLCEDQTPTPIAVRENANPVNDNPQDASPVLDLPISTPVVVPTVPVQQQSHFVKRSTDFEDKAVLKYDNHKSFVVYYNVGSANLDATAVYAINKAIAFTQDYDTHKIKVLGFADRIGDRDYNKHLSKKRADAVKNALIERGIPKEKIEVVTFGEDYSAVNTRDGIGESFNRRVVIEVNVSSEFDEDAFIMQKAGENEVMI